MTPSHNLLRTLRAILGAALLSVCNTCCIQGTAHNVVTHTRQVFHAATAHQDDGVFLQLVTLTRNIGGHFDAICEANAGDLPQCRIRLLGRHGTHDRTYSALLRCALVLTHAALLVRVQCILQGWGLAFDSLAFAAPTDHLIDCRHD